MERPILALIDFSDAAPAVVRIAVELARTQSRTLFLLHVTQNAIREVEESGEGDADVSVPDSPESPAEFERESRAVRRRLEILELEATRLGVRVSTLVLPPEGAAYRNPTALILEQIDRSPPAFVVMGSHGRHGRLYQLLIGTMTDKVLRHARCPVVVVPTVAEPEAVNPSPAPASRGSGFSPPYDNGGRPHRSGQGGGG